MPRGAPAVKADVKMYLVTGCSGFIGSHLVEALLAQGNAVVGVDAFTDYYARGLKEANVDLFDGDASFQLVEADLATDALEPLLEDVDGVFHLAAQPGVRGSWGETFALYARDNVVATQRVFEAAVAADVRVVWASSSSVYGNAETHPTREEARPSPISPYGVTKLTCEHLAGAYMESCGLEQIAVRYFTVYGPRQRPDMAFTKIARALADGTPFTVFGTGEQARDVTYVGDAVAATIAAMEKAPRGAVYNVGSGASSGSGSGSGSETTLNEVIALCERLAGRTLDRRSEPAAAGDVRTTSADITRARRELGWSPVTRLEDGLRAQLAWAGLHAELLAGSST
jgi:UDP-glucuronate 4-epimerase